jgi:hypothetical protein
MADMKLNAGVQYIGAARDQKVISDELGSCCLANTITTNVPDFSGMTVSTTPTLTGDIYRSFFSWFPVVRFQSDQAISGHKTQFMFKLTWPLTPSNPAPTIISSAYDLSLLQSGSDSLSYAYYVADSAHASRVLRNDVTLLGG